MAEDFEIAVRAAMDRPEIHAAVHEIYRRLQEEVQKRQPICVASGRCCKFDEFGHRLFVTTLEMATFLLDRSENPVPAPRQAPGGCPFQIGKLCGVHTIRPLGCRMFYCDPTAALWQQNLYEQLHASLKELHLKFDVPYFYIEWRRALDALGLRPM